MKFNKHSVCGYFYNPTRALNKYLDIIGEIVPNAMVNVTKQFLL